jgi:prophage antirepressor-like protein
MENKALQRLPKDDLAQTEVMMFDFGEQKVRAVMKDSEPWFVAKDVCDILGYANSRDAVETHCKHASILKSSESLLLDVPSRGLTIIPESD